MGSPIKFGSRIFAARGSGRLHQSNVSTKQVRYSTLTSNIALTSINATATFAASLPVIPGTGLINIKNIICMALFVDSSASSNYNVSSEVNIYIYPSSFSNLDYIAGAAIPRFPYQSGSVDYQILGNVDANSSIPIDVTVYGGDVVSKTLITPAAGDQVAFYLSMCYEPL